jgi:hypothetical protein
MLFTFSTGFITPLSDTTCYASSLVLANVYSNSILALLNNRAEIVGDTNTHVNFDWDTFKANISVLRVRTPGMVQMKEVPPCHCRQ